MKSIKHYLLVSTVLFFFLTINLSADPFQDALNQGTKYYQAKDYAKAEKAFIQASSSPNKDIASMACRNLGVYFNESGDQEFGF